MQEEREMKEEKDMQEAGGEVKEGDEGGDEM
jgi:hypothetical protein